MTTMGCCVDRKYGCGCTDETCMNLPDGKTCGDCVHLRRCVAIFGHKPEDTYCDFFPRRFQLRVVQ
jgi:hypothetical protein